MTSETESDVQTVKSTSTPYSAVRSVLFFGAWAGAFIAFVLWQFGLTPFKETIAIIALMAVNQIGVALSTHV